MTSYPKPNKLSPSEKVKVKNMGIKNAKYLKFIRSLPCSNGSHFCFDKAEAHHVRRSYWGAGTSTKPHDYVTVARCRTHHDPEYEVDVEQEIIGNLLTYIRRHHDIQIAQRAIIETLMQYVEGQR